MPSNVIAFSGEDALSESLAICCVRHTLPDFEVLPMRPQQGGRTAVEKNFASYVGTAKSLPFFVLLDLDDALCPPTARASILKRASVSNLPKYMIFSIIRRESEAWILGDPERLSQFLEVERRFFPDAPEILTDPKSDLIRIARKSRRLRREICPPRASSATVGAGYNYVLGDFINRLWRPDIAATVCPTLERTLHRLKALKE